MAYQLLIKAGLKKHRSLLLGIFLLVFWVSLALSAVLAMWLNSAAYIPAQLERAGFGQLTAWVSGAPEDGSLADEIAALAEVDRVEEQRILFANYTIGGRQSDSEGQLIRFDPTENRYRFFDSSLRGYRQVSQIQPGQVYVSPSLISMFGLAEGDSVDFAIARNGGAHALTVAGFYEDPFMGSAMIGMKGFLLCDEDYQALARTAQGAGIDALARVGQMLHIFQRADSSLPVAQLNSLINQGTRLPQYAEFVHSTQAIQGFMLVLQNAFGALLLAFVLILLAVVFVVLGHSIAWTLQADYVNMGILKAMGATSQVLSGVQLMQYGAAILPAMALGLALGGPFCGLASRATLSTTGVLIPANLPWAPCLAALAAMLALLGGFILLKTAKIQRISPMKAIRGEMGGEALRLGRAPGISPRFLSASLALRQLLSGKKKYVSACIVAMLLVFFASVVGRMDAWLGPNGQGMMDAFNPADHHIGVQMFGRSTDEQARDVVLRYTDITDSYLLAMPGVAVNGVDYTANVISEPSRFRILAGRTCAADDEIVLTEMVAAGLGVSIGDRLTVAGDGGSGQYTVSGLYACANDMGANIGMSREGYLKIGRDDPQIWCHHYFLADTSRQAQVIQALEATFGGDAYVHENTWPGLAGIIAAMGALVVFLYAMAALFILIVTLMTGSKLLLAERRDTGIFRALGFPDGRLRLSFALRFGMAAAVGALLGGLLAAWLTDPLVSGVMKLAGISNFASHPGVIGALFPMAVVPLLFVAFGYLAGGKMRKAGLTAMIAQ